MSEGKYNELELAFIEEVLDQHGEYLADLLIDDIQDKKLIDKENLMSGIDYRVSKYGIDPVLLFSFPAYGRFIEINFHKKSQNENIWDSKQANRDILGLRSNRKRKKKKDTRWYARNVYGSINRLLGVLGSEFTEHEKARLQRILDRQKSEIKL